MYNAHIGFSHGAEPIFIMRVAYTHIVSIGSAACQEPLGTMLYIYTFAGEWQGESLGECILETLTHAKLNVHRHLRLVG